MTLTVHVEPLPAAPADPLRLLAWPDPVAAGQRWAWLAPGGRALVGLGNVLATGADPHDLVKARAQAFGAQGMSGSRSGDSEHLCFFAGQGFDPAASPAGPGLWSAFPAACLALPEVALIVDPPAARLVLVAPPSRSSTTADLTGRARALAADLAAPSAVPADPVTPSAEPRPASLPAAAVADLRARVLAALAAIHGGEVHKVVVATAHTLQLAAALDPVAVLRRLVATQPGCFHYLVQPRPACALVGASPERLVAVDGSCVRTMALAGSAPRGADPAADEALGAALLASTKDRAEHQWVVDALRAALAPVATTITVPEAPRLRRLATIQHLETPIEAALPGQGDILELARRLHPTPALAGTPRDAALALIRRIEGDTRGWYGGLVGWLDTAGNGDLTVAIRCLLLTGDTATAFAGAGIVAGSDPEREVAEITLKLGAALGAVA